MARLKDLYKNNNLFDMFTKIMLTFKIEKNPKGTFTFNPPDA